MARCAIGTALSWATLALLVGAGCGQQAVSPREQVELLMAKNRRLEDELLATERQLAALTGTKATPAPPAPQPEDPFRAIAIRFGKYTGGLDTDGKVGDDRLKVVIEPLDAEGDVVKRAGSLVLEAYEEDGEERRLFHRWQWSREQFAKTWLRRLGLYYYVLKMPWPDGRPPKTDRLLLRAWFTTLSGEVLTADKSVPIRLPAPKASGHGTPAVPGASVPTLVPSLLPPDPYGQGIRPTRIGTGPFGTRTGATASRADRVEGAAAP